LTATSPTNVPYQASRATLVRASITALAAGAAMLVLVVLPAEYGIDPTGIAAPAASAVIEERTSVARDA